MRYFSSLVFSFTGVMRLLQRFANSGTSGIMFFLTLIESLFTMSSIHIEGSHIPFITQSGNLYILVFLFHFCGCLVIQPIVI